MKAGNQHTGAENGEKMWVDQIRRGDTVSFEKMVITYYEPLCKFANRIVKRSDVSEDLVQDLFVKIWEIRKVWDPPGTVKAYLFKAVKNSAINYHDHQEVRRRLHSSIVEEKQFDIMKSESKAEKLLKNKAFRAALQDAVNKLPERARLVYTLHRQDGFKYKEIAWIMDISQKTVESQMSRALKTLREKLQDFYSPVAVGVFLNLIF